MSLLDSNVISEPWKQAPDGAVITWMDAQAVETLLLSAITIAELRFGIAAMPTGKRQTILRDRLEGEVLPHFAGRILTVATRDTIPFEAAGLKVINPWSPHK